MFLLLMIGLSLMMLIPIFSSDQQKPYRVFTLLTFIPLVILEIPHYYLPDPFLVVDILVHFCAGLTIFLVFSNLSFIKREIRGILSISLTITIIVLVEIYLSIQEITTGYPNPIGLNSLQDIIWTILGGLIGYVIFSKTKKESLFRMKF